MKESISPDFVNYILNIMDNKYKDESDEFKRGYSQVFADIASFLIKYGLVMVFEDKDAIDIN